MTATSEPTPSPVVAALVAHVARSTSEGVVICDEQMTYVWVNPAGCALMGYRLEELVGRNFLMNFPERTHASMTEAYRAQLAGQTGTFTGTLQLPDGTELDMVWTNMTFVHDGRRYGAAIFHEASGAATAREVTGLALAAEATASGGDLIDILTRLADSGREHTRALLVHLDLVDPDLVIRRGGRSGAPPAFGAAQTAVSAASGRIPFIDVWYSGRAVILADARTRLRQDPKFAPLCDVLDAALDWQTAVYVAISHRDRVLGGLGAYFPAGVPAPTDAELTYLTTLADYAALATEHDRLRHAGERAAAVEERNQLARELHDSVSQALFAAAMHARSAEKQLKRHAVDAPKLADDLAALRQLTAAAQAEMRALIFELRPDALAAEGLVAALSRQAAARQARTGVPVSVSGPPGRLPVTADAEEHLYRIALEAVHNAAKHAGASHLTVAITDLGDVIEAVITDDGSGMDPTRHVTGHLGLQTMRERATAAGGSLTISSAPGTGTTVRCQVPAAAALSSTPSRPTKPTYAAMWRATVDSSDIIDLATRIQRRRDFAAHLSGFTVGAAVLAGLHSKKVSPTTQFAASLLVWATALSAQHFRHVLRGPVTQSDVATERARLNRKATN